MANEASIQTILSVEHCPNSDNLDVVNVLGWNVVTKRDEFKVGEPCVYVQIDTILPERPEFEFMRNKNFRVKTIRLRGQLSQGICFPINILETIMNGKIIKENDKIYFEFN